MKTRLRLGIPMASALVIGILMGIVSIASAGDYRSGFGFQISVPEVWLVLTRGEVSNHAEALLAQGGGEPTEKASILGAIPAEMRIVVLDRIQRGELEIFYREGSGAEGFVDNVNIMRQATPLPKTKEQLDAICRLLPREFSRVFGRPIAMDACEMRDMMGRAALYFQFDGAVVGTKSLQYQLASGSGDTIVVTATAAMPHLSRMMGEFESMVASIRFDE